MGHRDVNRYQDMEMALQDAICCEISPHMPNSSYMPPHNINIIVAVLVFGRIECETAESPSKLVAAISKWRCATISILRNRLYCSLCNVNSNGTRRFELRSIGE